MLAVSTSSAYSRDLLAGLSYSSGRATYMASLIHKNDRSPLNQDADQAAIGVMISLSRRTALHASLAHIRNRNAAPYTAGTATEPGKGKRALTFGLRHAF